MKFFSVPRALVFSFLAAVPSLAQRSRSETSIGPGRSPVMHVVGEVRLADGSAVAGAHVSSDGGSATTDAGGFFSIPQRLVRGHAAVVTATTRIVGANYRGVSDSVPVISALTDVGTITLVRVSVPIDFAPLIFGGSEGASEGADFDGDGDEDFVVQGPTNGTFLVLENGPDGFVETGYSPGFDVGAFFPLDLDQDGAVDLLTSNSVGPGGVTVSVFFNDGQGDFGAAVPVTNLVGTLTPGDFDGDDISDFVLVRTSVVSFFHGQGDGSFASPQLQPVSGAGGVSLAAELDGDELLDLVTGTGLGVKILSGDGDGTFTVVSSLTFAHGVGRIWADDLDGNGALDLLASTSALINGQPPSQHFVEPFLGLGNGAFVAGPATSLGTAEFAVELGELSADGRADLVLGTSSTGSAGEGPIASFRVVRGQGNGTFFSSNVSYGAGTSLGSVRLVDFDVDGRGDVIAGGAIYLGLGNAAFSYPQTPAGTYRAASTADYDLDGDLDLLLLNPAQGVQLSRENNGIFVPVAPVVALAPTGPNATGDLDGDADLDVIVVVSGNGASALRHDGAGHLAVASSFSLLGNSAQPVLADFDTDGDLDVAFSSKTFPGAVYLYPGNDDGTFGARSTLPASFQPVALVAGDWDADGEPDLMVQLTAGIAHWSGNGDGTFQAPVALTATGGLFGPHSASDMDGDGALDLLTSRAVLLGHGDGNFDDALTHGIECEDAGDVDGDGVLDLVRAATGTLQLHTGRSDGTVQGPLEFRFQPSEFAASAILGDFDEDGDADVLLRYQTTPNSNLIPNSKLILGRRVP